jgi:hypothetical protein
MKHAKDLIKKIKNKNKISLHVLHAPMYSYPRINIYHEIITSIYKKD